jgi:tetratricopeptide (TPR) repeat protein
MPFRTTIRAAFLVGSASAFSVSPSLGQDYGELYRQCYQGSPPDKVIAACSVVITTSGNDRKEMAIALKNRANAYDDKHEHELALNDFNQAAALNPEDADIFNSRSTTLAALGRYGQAIEDFNHALKLKPGLAMALSNRCFAKANVGQLDEAMADCNAALRLAPQSSEARASRAFVYLKSKRFEDAVRDYDAVLAVREDPYSLFGRAVAKRMKGDLRESDDDVVRAMAIKPDIAEHMARLGIELQVIRMSP